MRSVVLAALCLTLGACVPRSGTTRTEKIAPPPPRPVPVVVTPVLDEGELARWNETHRSAARDLCEWAGRHSDAARRIFEWDSRHPEQSRELVTWALGHPRADLADFVITHQGWRDWDVIAASHRPAANQLMVWSRRHPEAAEALMKNPGALNWAGHHLSC